MTTQNRSIGLLPAKLIRDFSKPVTRSNWREGSSLNAIITSDIWWLDYVHCSTITSPYYACTERVAIYPNFSWYNWCFETVILGPPRPRDRRERRPLLGDYYAEETWITWCRDKMIIGPPRSRSYREEAELDEDYLSMEDIIRHCRPWSRTWPHPDDRSWCTGPHKTTLPDWVIAEYNAAPNPTLC